MITKSAQALVKQADMYPEKMEELARIFQENIENPEKYERNDLLRLGTVPPLLLRSMQRYSPEFQKVPKGVTPEFVVNQEDIKHFMTGHIYTDKTGTNGKRTPVKISEFMDMLENIGRGVNVNHNRQYAHGGQEVRDMLWSQHKSSPKGVDHVIVVPNKGDYGMHIITAYPIKMKEIFSKIRRLTPVGQENTLSIYKNIR